MTLEQLEAEIPALLDYTRTMPLKIRQHAIIRKHPPGGLIHQKDCELQYFGIVARGENRVINEFENGKVYMIESNLAIDFIGEVTILAKKERTSVTIEAVTENTIVYIPRKDAEKWVAEDEVILRKMAERTAFKLYRSSYNNGLKLFYPPSYLLADYLVKTYEQALSSLITYTPRRYKTFVLQKTRERLAEELGMNIKTLDRTVRSMNKDEYFHLVKGKISFTFEQNQKLKEYLSASRS